MPKQAVLTIWIPKQGFVRQGKFCLIDNKPCFIANMTARKWWKNYSGYAIAKRILEKLPRGTRIIFKRVDLNTSYETNKTKFQKKGILVSFGFHSQWCLPLKDWKVIKGMPKEPHQLPVISLDKWLKTGASSSPVLASGPFNNRGTMKEYVESRLKLREIFNKEIRYV